MNSNNEKPKLKTLHEADKQARMARQQDANYPKANGIACPVCGTELNDLDAMLLMSLPPKRAIGCLMCGYRGTRVA